MMGYIKHNAIVITSNDEEQIYAAASRSRELGLIFLGPSAPASNGYRSILICPDGSKEGYEGSNLGDAKRELLKKWLRDHSYLDWVEIYYGSEDASSGVVDDAWRELPKDPE